MFATMARPQARTLAHLKAFLHGGVSPQYGTVREIYLCPTQKPFRTSRLRFFCAEASFTLRLLCRRGVVRGRQSFEWKTNEHSAFISLVFHSVFPVSDSRLDRSKQLVVDLTDYSSFERRNFWIPVAAPRCPVECIETSCWEDKNCSALEQEVAADLQLRACLLIVSSRDYCPRLSLVSVFRLDIRASNRWRKRRIDGRIF